MSLVLVLQLLKLVVVLFSAKFEKVFELGKLLIFPIKSFKSLQIDKLHWARSHDAEARSIAARARDFARRRLMPREVLCYHAKVVQQWEKRLRDKRFEFFEFGLFTYCCGKVRARREI